MHRHSFQPVGLASGDERCPREAVNTKRDRVQLHVWILRGSAIQARNGRRFAFEAHPSEQRTGGERHFRGPTKDKVLLLELIWRLREGVTFRNLEM